MGMTRLERILDGMGTVDDALRPLRDRMTRHKLPHTDDVRMCASLLRCAAATLEGALTLPMPEGGENGDGRMPSLLGKTEPPGEDLWFRKGDLA